VGKESDWYRLEERGERERKKLRNKRGWLVGGSIYQSVGWED
jgi:hypothetical protein